jgi:uncharacterized protein (TIGR02594 family)
MVDILTVQRALSLAGFDPGPLDGIAGARTRAAVKAFQRARGLISDGIAGPNTLALLIGGDAVPSEALTLPWLAEAKRLSGLKEVAGAGNSPVIMDWAQDLKVGYAGDDVPWCGLFVAHCMAAGLPGEPLPANVLGARNWLKFGVQVSPQNGAVMVFWRGSPGGWTGHVGFYAGEDREAFVILGGNQSNGVNETRIPRARLLGARWPVLMSVPATGRRVMRDGAGGFSQSEA